MSGNVLAAIFRRDFVRYFSNPTGYVFICVFVVLSALAAFWPPEFFSNNLANLDQLSKWLPFIMLVFIPAITMSIWAEERRQGTDELLLTLPASDVVVVVGKYLAGVAIFTVSLLFSMFSIYLVFAWGLGSPDVGLFLGTYAGYWFVGIAMLSIGMVASFLTSNLTVGFILGMLFNLPLAVFGVADWIIKSPTFAQTVKRWSLVEHFQDFERGVISLGGISYFVMIVAVMLYVSIVLISRRHWSGGEDGNRMWGHYLLRSLSLVLLAAGVNLIASNYNVLRWDITSENINSLSDRTVRLVSDLEKNNDVPVIKIDAYVSPQVPAEFAAQKRNLLSTLQEFSALSGGKIQVDIHEIETFSEEATLAEKTYGIEPREVDTKSRGARTTREIYLGAAFTCGLDRVVLPFIDKGIPIEYELVRSICTVAQQERKKLGVLKTDAQLFGGFTMQGLVEESRIIGELRKQYDVVEVDPTKPITDHYDVLLAVQPSSLSPEAMDNFVACVKSGQPTAIFEDPFPWPEFYGTLPGTAQPKRPGGAMEMFGGGGPPQPKGDINQLWKLLGVEMDGDQIVWQAYNPEPKVDMWAVPEWVFIDDGNGAIAPFNPNDPISSGMNQLLFFHPGSFTQSDKSTLEFTELAVTGTNTGSLSYMDQEMARRSGGQMALRRVTTREPYVIAAHVKGTVRSEDELHTVNLADKSKENISPGGSDDAKPKDDVEDVNVYESNINVVLVADIDYIAPVIFMLREMGDAEDALVDWKFQNVPFVLNILDVLADDDRFVAIRKRTRPHRILTKIEEATESYRAQSLDDVKDFVSEASQQIEVARKEFNDKIAELENRTDLDSRAKAQLTELERIRLERVRDVKVASLERDRDRQIKLAQRELDAKIRGLQDRYKLFAVVLPPILPILLAFFVFFHRREAEREGVTSSRLRYGGAAVKKTKEDLRVPA
jgi:ABC-2 type transport system permease protein